MGRGVGVYMVVRAQLNVGWGRICLVVDDVEQNRKESPHTRKRFGLNVQLCLVSRKVGCNNCMNQWRT